MAFRTLRAHFDGQNVQIDEPCDLKSDDRLYVVVLDKQAEDEEELEDDDDFDSDLEPESESDPDSDFSLADFPFLEGLPEP